MKCVGELSSNFVSKCMSVSCLVGDLSDSSTTIMQTVFFGLDTRETIHSNVKMKGLQRAAGTVRKTVEKVVVHPPYFYQYLPAGEASAAPPLGPLLGRVQYIGH